MLDAILIMGTAVVPVSMQITALYVNVLVLILKMEYQMRLLEIAFATMKQILSSVGLMDLIAVYQMLLISTVQNVLVAVSGNILL